MHNHKLNFFRDRFFYLKKVNEENLKKILLLKDKKYNNKKCMQILKNRDEAISNFIIKNYVY